MGEWTDAKIEVSYGPDYSELGKPPEPVRGNDGSFILMGGDRKSEDRKRIAVVDFHGKAKRGELYRAPDPEGLANAHRLAACWNFMYGIEDPTNFMAEVYECLDRFEDYFDNRADVDTSSGNQEPNTEMQHLVAIREILAMMEKNNG